MHGTAVSPCSGLLIRRAQPHGRFCELARADGRRSVRAVTSVVNRDSIAFHQRLGFVLLPGDLEIDGLPATGEPGVPEGAIVRFELRLDDLAAGHAQGRS